MAVKEGDLNEGAVHLYAWLRCEFCGHVWFGGIRMLPCDVRCSQRFQCPGCMKPGRGRLLRMDQLETLTADDIGRALGTLERYWAKASAGRP